MSAILSPLFACTKVMSLPRLDVSVGDAAAEVAISDPCTPTRHGFCHKPELLHGTISEGQRD